MLITFAGLPGSGKTTLAAAVAQRLGATYLRVDAIEAGLVRAGLMSSDSERGPAGYIVATSVARSCLLRHLTVVVDAVNPVKESRDGWAALAADTDVPVLFVEVICSDPAVHEARVTERPNDTPQLALVAWQQILDWHYEAWDRERLVVDNLGDPAPHIDRVVRAAHDLRRSP